MNAGALVLPAMGLGMGLLALIAMGFAKPHSTKLEVLRPDRLILTAFRSLAARPGEMLVVLIFGSVIYALSYLASYSATTTATLAGLACSLIAYLAIVYFGHRLVLLEEPPFTSSPQASRQFWAIGVRVLAIFGLFLLLGIAFILLVFLISALLPDPAVMPALAIILFVLTIMSTHFVRLSFLFPAAILGDLSWKRPVFEIARHAAAPVAAALAALLVATTLLGLGWEWLAHHLAPAREFVQTPVISTGPLPAPNPAIGVFINRDPFWLAFIGIYLPGAILPTASGLWCVACVSAAFRTARQVEDEAKNGGTAMSAEDLKFASR
jgi:hypothetical protein